MAAISSRVPSMEQVIGKRLGIPVRQHHLSVFKTSIKFRTAFADGYGISESDHVFFLFGGMDVPDADPVVYMIVTRLYSPHAAKLHYSSYNGIRDRRLSIWRQPVCDMLRGVFNQYIEPYERNTCQRPSLRLSAKLIWFIGFAKVFQLMPTRDLFSIQQSRKAQT